MDISSPITYKKNINSGNMGVGLENDSFSNDDKEKVIRSINFKNNNYISNYWNIYDINNNLDANYENIDRICMNSKRCLNNLMSNTEKMEKAFLDDDEFFKLSHKSNNNNNMNYLNSLKKHRLIFYL